jgi:deoxyribonuclease V
MRTNKELDTYPCYKVVASNWWLSGYVLGLEEKIRRLKNDWIEIDGEKIKVDYIITNFI